MPIRDRISVPTQLCLETQTDGPIEVLTEIGLPVEIARNRLVERVLAMKDRPRFVIWADADAVWTANTFSRLRADVTRLGPHALIGVLHGPRAAFAHPHVFIDTKPPIGTPIRWGIDYPKEMQNPSALRRVCFVGAHMYAHDVRLLNLIGRDPWSLRHGEPSEDFAFVFRVHRSGGTVWCDTAVPVFHFDEAMGLAFLPGYVTPFTVSSNGALGEQLDDERASAVPRLAERRSYGAAVDAHMARNEAMNVPATALRSL